MSNRFHSKYHRQNHHTYSNPYNADAGHDPIASTQQPFKGDFVLAGALSCFAPNSATAGFFYSNNVALCAYAGKKAIHAFSSGDGTNTGIYVYSSGIALSALAGVVGINVYSYLYGIDVYGYSNSIRAYSPNYGIESYGGKYGGSFTSPIMGLSSYGGIYGAQITSPQFGLNVFGGTYGGNFYSNTRGISAYGGQIGIDVVSPARGINVRGTNEAIVASSPTIALSSGGGGVNIFNNRTGIFKTPQSNMSFDVKGNSYMDGDLTVTGDISAYGIYSYFETKVTVTSAFRVVNVGTEPAVTIEQTGNYPVLVCYDADVSTSIPSFIVDGARSGWVGLGTSSPQAPLYVVKNATQSNNQPQFLLTDNGSNPKRMAVGVEIDRYTNPFLGTESPHHLLFNSNSSTRMILTSSGEFIIGDYIGSFSTIENLDGSGTTALNTVRSKFQSIGNQNGGSYSIYRTSLDTVPASIFLNKSNSSTPNTLGAVSVGHRLGKISFSGYDGASFVEGATIDSVVTGAPAANSVPTDITFNTYSSGLASLKEVVRINSSQNVGIGTSPEEKLHISSDYVFGTVIRSDNTSAGGRNWATYSTGSSNAEGAGKYLIRDITASAVRLAIDSSGNVGIGLRDPSERLTVSGNVSASGNVIAPNATFASTNLINGTVGDARYDRLPGYRYEDFETFMYSTGLKLGLAASAGSGGGTAAILNPSPANTMGVIRMSTTTTAAANCGGRINVVGQTRSINLANGVIKYVINGARSSATWFDGTLTGALRLGLADQITTEPAYGVYFRALNGNAVQFVTRNNNVETATNTGVNLVNGTYNTFEFEVNSNATQVIAKIDGTTVATHSTNIPSAYALQIMNQLNRVSATGTDVIYDVDWLYFSHTPNTPYFT